MSKAKELEQRLERTEQQLRLFQKVSRLMVRDLSLHEVLQSITGLVVDFMQCDSCLIYLLDGNELVLCSTNHPNPDPVGKIRLRMGEGLTGWVAKERRFVAIAKQAYLDPRFKHFASLKEDTFEAFLSAPVIVRNRVVGVMNVQHRQPHAYSGEEMEALTTLGEQVGCLLVLSGMTPDAVERACHVDMVLASSPRS